MLIVYRPRLLMISTSTHEARDQRQVVKAESQVDLEADGHEKHPKQKRPERCDVSLHLDR